MNSRVRLYLTRIKRSPSFNSLNSGTSRRKLINFTAVKFCMSSVFINADILSGAKSNESIDEALGDDCAAVVYARRRSFRQVQSASVNADGEATFAGRSVERKRRLSSKRCFFRCFSSMVKMKSFLIPRRTTFKRSALDDRSYRLESIWTDDNADISVSCRIEQNIELHRGCLCNTNISVSPKVAKHSDGRTLKSTVQIEKEKIDDRPLQDSQAIWPKLYPIAWPSQTTHVKSAFLFLFFAGSLEICSSYSRETIHTRMTRSFIYCCGRWSSSGVVQLDEEFLDIVRIEMGEKSFLFVGDRTDNDDFRLVVFLQLFVFTIRHSFSTTNIYEWREVKGKQWCVKEFLLSSSRV